MISIINMLFREGSMVLWRPSRSPDDHSGIAVLSSAPGPRKEAVNLKAGARD